MTATLPIVDAQTFDEGLAADAMNGSFCPKMCNFACPALVATGLDDAMPWSLHRTVHDLVTGRLTAGEAAWQRLRPCSGCLACQDACTKPQDVPAQVREARHALAAAGLPQAADAAAAVAVDDGPDLPADADDADVVIVAVHADTTATLASLERLVRAAGRAPRWVLATEDAGIHLDAVGARDAAAAAAAEVRGAIADAEEVVVTDAALLGPLAVEGGTAPMDVVSWLAARVDGGDLQLRAAEHTVTVHEPAVLGRVAGAPEAVRRLIAAAGAELAEPEGAGAHTVCEGSGMALPVLAPDVANAMAARRVGMLAATGAPIVLAASSASLRLLNANGGSARHLLDGLASHL